MSDESGVIAQPLPAVAAQPDSALAARLAGIAADLAVTAIVVGLPRRLTGAAGPEAQAARHLAQELREQTRLPVTLVDERLSSVEAERALISAGRRREQRRREVDSVAAALILQTYLGRRGR